MVGDRAVSLEMAGLHHRLMLVVLLQQCLSQLSVSAQPLFPAFFIFGDSLVDSGQNNYVTLALARANLPPNGIDFVTHRPTGRFCNGKHTLDVLSDYIGLPYPPPSKAPTSKGSAILKGLNYASGAGGILDATGANYIERLSFNTQITLFQQTVLELNALLGGAGATDLLRKSLFAVVHGSNDYINNYLLPKNNATRNQYTPSQFVQLLMATFKTQLTTIYNLGARKVLVSNVGPVGCIPSRLALGSPDGRCVASENEMAVGFNVALKSLLQELTQTLPGSLFLYGNVYDGVLDTIENPQSQGFSVSNIGCCGGGKYKGQVPCLPIVENLCPNRDQFVFWDPYHPTQAVNEIIGRRSFQGPPSDISPINIQQLAVLEL